jgi:hypothetical protein
VQPREQAFNFPMPLVAAKVSVILRLLALSIRFMRRNQLSFKLGETFIQLIEIVSL